MITNEIKTAKKKWPAWVISPLAVFILWSAVLYGWTGGFQSFTVYSYAMQKAGALPRPMPHLELTDRGGRGVNLGRWKGKYLLVDFTYLQCTSICGILRSRLINYYDQLSLYIPHKLEFLSVSFDYERDTPEVLDGAWRASGGHTWWNFTVISNTRENIQALEKTGIVAIKNNTGDYNHTAYLYVIDPAGILVGIFDPSLGAEKNLQQIIQLLRQTPENEGKSGPKSVI